MNKIFFENILPGTLLFNRFRLEACLGAKDIGGVYRCRDIQCGGRKVALKVVLADLDVGEHTCCLYDEVTFSQSVHHPHVLRAEKCYSDNDFRAYTMDFMEGGSLNCVLERAAIFPLVERMRLFAQICSGVTAIHRAGIIHRDLKPENVLVTAGFDVRISDFGIATSMERVSVNYDPSIVGTVDYLSPEYVLEGQSSPLVDIYALGVIGYHLVTGRLPFKAQSLETLLSMKAFCDPIKPSQLSTDCPGALSDLILQAMERRPELRIQSASSLLAQLRTISTRSPYRSTRLSRVAVQ